jgi:hypothetical protein
MKTPNVSISPTLAEQKDEDLPLVTPNQSLSV